MIGDDADPGVTHRAVQCFFDHLQEQETLEYLVRASYIEIYNEELVDLLDPSKAGLRLYDDSVKGVYVRNLTEVAIRSADDALRLIERGQQHRQVAATHMNERSSRSHTIFKIVLETGVTEDGQSMGSQPGSQPGFHPPSSDDDDGTGSIDEPALRDRPADPSTPDCSSSPIAKLRTRRSNSASRTMDLPRPGMLSSVPEAKGIASAPTSPVHSHSGPIRRRGSHGALRSIESLHPASDPDQPSVSRSNSWHSALSTGSAGSGSGRRATPVGHVRNRAGQSVPSSPDTPLAKRQQKQIHRATRLSLGDSSVSVEHHRKVTYPPVRVSTLNLVDLAGSERANGIEMERQRRLEGAMINKSLLTLGRVISALSEHAVKVAMVKRKNKVALQRAKELEEHAMTEPLPVLGYVPYRTSKLTRLLASSLGGNARTAVICTICPGRFALEESRSTLHFARSVKRIVNTASVNHVSDQSALLAQYRAEIAALKDSMGENIANLEARLALEAQRARELELRLQQDGKSDQHGGGGTHEEEALARAGGPGALQTRKSWTDRRKLRGRSGSVTEVSDLLSTPRAGGDQVSPMSSDAMQDLDFSHSQLSALQQLLVATYSVLGSGNTRRKGAQDSSQAAGRQFIGYLTDQMQAVQQGRRRIESVVNDARRMARGVKGGSSRRRAHSESPTGGIASGVRALGLYSHTHAKTFHSKHPNGAEGSDDELAGGSAAEDAQDPDKPRVVVRRRPEQSIDNESLYGSTPEGGGIRVVTTAHSTTNRGLNSLFVADGEMQTDLYGGDIDALMQAVTDAQEAAEAAERRAAPDTRMAALSVQSLPTEGISSSPRKEAPLPESQVEMGEKLTEAEFHVSKLQTRVKELEARLQEPEENPLEGDLAAAREETREFQARWKAAQREVERMRGLEVELSDARENAEMAEEARQAIQAEMAERVRELEAEVKAAQHGAEASLQSTTDETNQLKSKLEERDAEVKQLTERLAEARTEAEEQGANVESSSKVADRLKARLEERDAEVKHLTERLAEAEAEAEEQGASVQSSSKATDRLKARLEERDRELAEASTQLADSQHSQRQTQAALDSVRAELQGAQQALTASEARAASAQAELDSLREAQATTGTALQRTKSMNSNLEAKVATLEANLADAIASAQGDSAAKAGRVQALKKRIEAVEQARDTVAAELEEKVIELSTARTELATARSAQRLAETDASTLRDDYERLKAELREAQEQVRELEPEKTRLQRELQAMERRATASEEQVSASADGLERDVRDLRRQLGEVMRERDEAAAELSEAQASLASAQKEAKHLKVNSRALVEQSREHEAEVERLEEELQETRQQLRGMEGEKARLQRELQAIQRRVATSDEQVTASADDREREIRELRLQLDSQEQEKVQAEHDLALLRTKLASTSQQLAEASSALTETEERAAVTERELAGDRIRLKTLAAALETTEQKLNDALVDTADSREQVTDMKLKMAALHAELTEANGEARHVSEENERLTASVEKWRTLARKLGREDTEHAEREAAEWETERLQLQAEVKALRETTKKLTEESAVGRVGTTQRMMAAEQEALQLTSEVERLRGLLTEARTRNTDELKSAQADTEAAQAQVMQTERQLAELEQRMREMEDDLAHERHTAKHARAALESLQTSLTLQRAGDLVGLSDAMTDDGRSPRAGNSSPGARRGPSSLNQSIDRFIAQDKAEQQAADGGQQAGPGSASSSVGADPSVLAQQLAGFRADSPAMSVKRTRGIRRRMSTRAAKTRVDQLAATGFVDAYTQPTGADAHLLGDGGSVIEHSGTDSDEEAGLELAMERVDTDLSLEDELGADPRPHDGLTPHPSQARLSKLSADDVEPHRETAIEAELREQLEEAWAGYEEMQGQLTKLQQEAPRLRKQLADAETIIDGDITRRQNVEVARRQEQDAWEGLTNTLRARLVAAEEGRAEAESAVRQLQREVEGLKARLEAAADPDGPSARLEAELEVAQSDLETAEGAASALRKRMTGLAAQLVGLEPTQGGQAAPMQTSSQSDETAGVQSPVTNVDAQDDIGSLRHRSPPPPPLLEDTPLPMLGREHDGPQSPVTRANRDSMTSSIPATVPGHLAEEVLYELLVDAAQRVSGWKPLQSSTRPTPAERRALEGEGANGDDTGADADTDTAGGATAEEVTEAEAEVTSTAEAAADADADADADAETETEAEAGTAMVPVGAVKDESRPSATQARQDRLADELRSAATLARQLQHHRAHLQAQLAAAHASVPAASPDMSDRGVGTETAVDDSDSSSLSPTPASAPSLDDVTSHPHFEEALHAAMRPQLQALLDSVKTAEEQAADQIKRLRQERDALAEELEEARQTADEGAPSANEPVGERASEWEGTVCSTLEDYCTHLKGVTDELRRAGREEEARLRNQTVIGSPLPDGLLAPTPNADTAGSDDEEGEGASFGDVGTSLDCLHDALVGLIHASAREISRLKYRKQELEAHAKALQTHVDRLETEEAQRGEEGGGKADEGPGEDTGSDTDRVTELAEAKSTIAALRAREAAVKGSVEALEEAMRQEMARQQELRAEDAAVIAELRQRLEDQATGQAGSQDGAQGPSQAEAQAQLKLQRAEQETAALRELLQHTEASLDTTRGDLGRLQQVQAHIWPELRAAGDTIRELRCRLRVHEESAVDAAAVGALQVRLAALQQEVAQSQTTKPASEGRVDAGAQTNGPVEGGSDSAADDGGAEDKDLVVRVLHQQASIIQLKELVERKTAAVEEGARAYRALQAALRSVRLAARTNLGEASSDHAPRSMLPQAFFEAVEDADSMLGSDVQSAVFGPVVRAVEVYCHGRNPHSAAAIPTTSPVPATGSALPSRSAPSTSGLRLSVPTPPLSALTQQPNDAPSYLRRSKPKSPVRGTAASSSTAPVVATAVNGGHNAVSAWQAADAADDTDMGVGIASPHTASPHTPSGIPAASLPDSIESTPSTTDTRRSRGKTRQRQVRSAASSPAPDSAEAQARRRREAWQQSAKAHKGGGSRSTPNGGSHSGLAKAVRSMSAAIQRGQPRARPSPPVGKPRPAHAIHSGRQSADSPAEDVAARLRHHLFQSSPRSSGPPSPSPQTSSMMDAVRAGYARRGAGDSTGHP